MTITVIEWVPMQEQVAYHCIRKCAKTYLRYQAMWNLKMLNVKVNRLQVGGYS